MKKKTKRVRLLRSIYLNGDVAEKGSVHELPIGTAELLIGPWSCAVELNFVWRFVVWIRKNFSRRK